MFHQANDWDEQMVPVVANLDNQMRKCWDNLCNAVKTGWAWCKCDCPCCDETITCIADNLVGHPVAAGVGGLWAAT